MHIGAQYYRAPFPLERYWEDDLKLMAASGLDTVQLWVLWSWVEAEPGTYRFDDYDRLVELAGANGLKVVLSTIAAVHPHWIHREIPDSEMVNHEGLKVVSTNRNECHFGITPGACFDHPQVRQRQLDFIKAVAEQYKDMPHLLGWDAWNELRWSIHANGYVCFCEHTLKRYRTWLQAKFESLEAMNQQLHRRFHSWDDVMPIRVPGRPFTDAVLFEEFITERGNAHGRDRIEAIRSVDSTHTVSLHAETPGPLRYESHSSMERALERGNDWALAAAADAYGTSAFPLWNNPQDLTAAQLEFAGKIQSIRSAGEAGTGKIWLSEIQGGQVASTTSAHRSVDYRTQQKWIWTAQAAGVDTTLFWCWRDEIFGLESSGFGLAGDDGLAPERLRAMVKTRKVMEKHADLLAHFTPDRGRVGLLFSPMSYYTEWAAAGNSEAVRDAMDGYMRALLRLNIPFVVVEENNLQQLDGLEVLICPRTHTLSDDVCRGIAAFAEAGGTVIAESEFAAWDDRALYRYRSDRFYVEPTGLQEACRQFLPASKCFDFEFDERELHVPIEKWATPIEAPEHADTIAPLDGFGAGIVRAPWGRGSLILQASYPGTAYFKTPTRDFEALLSGLLQEHISPEAQVYEPAAKTRDFVQVYTGRSGEKRLAFVIFNGDVERAELRFRSDFWKHDSATDILTDTSYEAFDREGSQQLSVDRPEWEIAVLVG